MHLPRFLFGYCPEASKVEIRFMGTDGMGFACLQFLDIVALGLYVVRKVAYCQLEIFEVRIALYNRDIENRPVVVQVDDRGMRTEGGEQGNSHEREKISVY